MKTENNNASSRRKKKGIPSEYALFLDNELKFKLSSKESISMEEYLEILFPKKYQGRYHEIALKLLNELKNKKEGMRSNKEIKEFIEREKIFRETLYTKIIDKMDRFGFIEKGYIKDNEKINKKIRGKPFYIKISLQYADLFKKLSDQWYMFYMQFSKERG